MLGQTPNLNTLHRTIDAVARAVARQIEANEDPSQADPDRLDAIARGSADDLVELHVAPDWHPFNPELTRAEYAVGATTREFDVDRVRECIFAAKADLATELGHPDDGENNELAASDPDVDCRLVLDTTRRIARSGLRERLEELTSHLRLDAEHASDGGARPSM